MASFSKISYLVAAWCLLASVVSADPAPPSIPAANNCDPNSGPFAKLSNAGAGFDNRPNNFEQCSVSWVYNQVVTGVEVWSDDWRINGLKIYYNGDVKPFLFGRASSSNEGHSDRYAKITWNQGDTMSKIGFANNQPGDGIGGIHIEMSGGQKLSVGPVATAVDSGTKGYDFNWVANPGILLGARGKTDGASPNPDPVAALRGWWPLFLGQDVSKGQLVAMTFDQSVDQLNAKDPGSTSYSNEVYIRNSNPSGSGNQSWTYSGTTSLMTMTQIQDMTGSTGGMTIGVTTEFEVGLPELISGKVGASVEGSWQIQKSNTNTWGTQQTQSNTFTQGSAVQDGTIPPGKAMHCQSVTMTGQYDLGYLGFYQFTWNSNTFHYMQHGTLNHTHHSESFGSCGLVDVSSIPASASVSDAGASSHRRRGIVGMRKL